MEKLFLWVFGGTNNFLDRRKDSHSYLRNQTVCKKPEKNSGLNGIWTHDFCDAGAVLYQLRYQANWELVILWAWTFPAPSWLDISVGRALHQHRRGHEFKSRSSLNFFQVFHKQSGCTDNCENLFFYLIFHLQYMYMLHMLLTHI